MRVIGLWGVGGYFFFPCLMNRVMPTSERTKMPACMACHCVRGASSRGRSAKMKPATLKAATSNKNTMPMIRPIYSVSRSVGYCIVVTA